MSPVKLQLNEEERKAVYARNGLEDLDSWLLRNASPDKKIPKPKNPEMRAKRRCSK